MSLKAPSEKQALTKLRKFVERAADKGIGYDLTNYRVELDAARSV